VLNADVDDFPAEQAADEPWFIERKDRDPTPELKRQGLFLSRLHNQAPAVHAFAVPNSGKRSDWERIARWREGAVAGALDLIIFWRGGVFFAEFKDKDGMPSRPQRDMLNSIYRAGHHCGVYRTADTLLAHLRAAGAPFLDQPQPGR
jgi:hypothetical protein